MLITVEDCENRAKLKLERAVEEVKKLLTVVSSGFLNVQRIVRCETRISRFILGQFIFIVIIIFCSFKFILS